MNKGLLFAAAAALLSVVPMAAQAEGEAFITASGGPSHTSLHGVTSSLGSYADYYDLDSSSHVDKKDAVFGLTGGYRWTVDEAFSIGLEGGIVDLGKVKGEVDTGYAGVFSEQDRGSIHTRGAIVGINAKWNLGYNWTLGVRSGYLHTWTRTKESFEAQYVYPYYGDRGGSGKDNSSDDGFYSGISVGYEFTRHFAVGLGYDYYHSDYDGYFGKSAQKTGVVALSAEVRF